MSDGARELAQKIASAEDFGVLSFDEMAALIDAELKELIDGAMKAADQLYHAAYQDEAWHHRQGRKLARLIKKWNGAGS